MNPSGSPYLTFSPALPFDSVPPCLLAPSLIQPPWALDASSARGIFDPLFARPDADTRLRVQELINAHQISHLTLPASSKFEDLGFLMTSCPAITSLTIECPELPTGDLKPHPLSEFLRIVCENGTLTRLELKNCAPFTVPLKKHFRSIKELIIGGGERSFHRSKMSHIGELLGGVRDFRMHSVAPHYGSKLSIDLFWAANRHQQLPTMHFDGCHMRAFDDIFAALASEGSFCKNLTELHINLKNGFTHFSTAQSKEYGVTMKSMMAMIENNKSIRQFSLTSLHFTKEKQRELIEALKKNTSLISVAFDHLSADNEYYRRVVEIMHRNMRCQADERLQAHVAAEGSPASTLMFEPLPAQDDLPAPLPLPRESTSHSHAPELPLVRSLAPGDSRIREGGGGRKRRLTTPSDSEENVHFSLSRSPSPTARQARPRNPENALQTASRCLQWNDGKSFVRAVNGANLKELEVHEGFKNLPAWLPHCTGIQVLRLGCEIDDPSALAFSQLMKTGNLPLQRLVFDGCKASSLALQNIFLSLHQLHQLSRLRIRMVQAGDWVETLASQLKKCRFAELCLESLQLTRAHADVLGRKIAHAPDITHLELSERGSGVLLTLIGHLAQRQGGSPLKRIGLRWMDGQDCRKAVADISRILATSPHLDTVEVTDNHFNEIEIDALIEAIETAGVATRADLRQWNSFPTQDQQQRLDDFLSRQILDRNRVGHRNSENDEMTIA